MKNGIIAFCGSKFSGKSTSAKMIAEILPGQTEELAFAEHLKLTCSKVFGVDMKYFLDPNLKEVEMDSYVNLTPKNVEQVFKEFDVTNYEYDKHVRPHVAQVFETPRSLLQYVGTEILHPIDPLIHAKITLKKKDPTKLSIITDLRFLLEFEYLMNTQAEGFFIPVYVANQKAEFAAAGDTHKSEQDLKTFKVQCVQMENNGTLPELRDKLYALVKKYDL
jgi:energy-coupling factor transporter ATP-binding protein EcfA2